MRASPFVSVCVCLALALAPVSVDAAPPNDNDNDDDQAELSRAKELFDAGVARYTAADYEAAVDLWLQAYAIVPPSYENRLILAELIYNVARAQQKWFDIDKDIKHLRQAREILARYLGEVNELYPPDQVELERIQEQIDGLDKQVAEWEAEQARREAELAERMRPKFDEEADAREARRNKAMIGSGAGLTALGAGGIGMLVAGLIIARNAESTVSGLQLQADIIERERAIDRGRAGNGLMLTGTLAGVVFLAAGVPLLGVGLAAEKKRKQRRSEAGLEVVELRSVGPMWISGGAGLSLGGSFGLAPRGRLGTRSLASLALSGT